MVSLIQIKNTFEAVETLNGGKDAVFEHISSAIGELQCALNSMDSLQVMGRSNLDRLFGCMVTVEAIIGDDNNG